MLIVNVLRVDCTADADMLSKTRLPFFHTMVRFSIAKCLEVENPMESGMPLVQRYSNSSMWLISLAS